MRALAGMICAAAVWGCTGSAAPTSTTGASAGSGGSSPVVCGKDQVPGDSGCETVGVPESACEPGTLPIEGGGCQDAGVPPEHCAKGFTAEDHGCTPILPARACPAGTMAVPGDAACREVAPCADGDWGDIPVDATTVYVKADYAGPSSDGTAAAPWKTIQQGIDAATPGAIVAIAAGTYAEAPTVGGKAVRLWGRCPSLVEVAPTGNGLAIGAGADGSELHRVSVAASGWAAVGVTAAKDVLLEQIWVHDGAVKRGLDLTQGAGVTVRGSLVENISVTGIMIWGATASVEGTEVRGTHAPSSGYGVVISVDTTTGVTSKATVSGSTISDNERIGVLVAGADATIEGSVIRDTQPSEVQLDGFGLLAQVDVETHDRSTLALRGSVLERNAGFAFRLVGSDAIVEDTVVRDSLPLANQSNGVGVAVVDEPATLDVAHGTIRSSLVERSRSLGVSVIGAALVLESTLVRDTLSEALDHAGGFGLQVLLDFDTGFRASAELRGSVIQRSNGLGLTVWGSDLVLEDSVVRDTTPDSATGLFGGGIALHEDTTEAPSKTTIRRSLVEGNNDCAIYSAGGELTIEATTIRDTRSEKASGEYGGGIAIQPGDRTSNRGKASITTSRIEGNQYFGLLVYDSTVTLDRSVVAATSGQTSDELFGDGIIVATLKDDLITTSEYDASLDMQRTVVEGSWRAGVSNFGSAVSVGGSVLECNAIHLDAEVYGDRQASFDDLGGNACGCDGAAVACTIMSSSLEPPSSLGAPKQ